MKNKGALDAAFLVLRVVVGVIFVAHGAQKVFGAFGGNGIGAFSVMIGKLGFVPPLLWAWIAALTEFVFGMCLILGVLPRLSAAMIAVDMLVAIVKVHGPHGFFAMNGGFEFPLLILASCVSLMLSGAGKISVFNKF